jgi:hypothetical protein
VIQERAANAGTPRHRVRPLLPVTAGGAVR